MFIARLVEEQNVRKIALVDIFRDATPVNLVDHATDDVINCVRSGLIVSGIFALRESKIIFSFT